jgi:hypothetical protein
VRNGWTCSLAGLTAKWELFSKTGKTSDTIVVLQSGELPVGELRAGQTCALETPFVEFRGTESDAAGFTGNKFCGYRIRFSYKGVEVKVVALPTTLLGWQPK